MNFFFESTDSLPDGSKSQSFVMIEKQEDSEDLEDCMTEAPQSPQSPLSDLQPVSNEDQPAVAEMSVQNKRANGKYVEMEQELCTTEADQGVTVNVKEKRNIQNRPKTPMNFTVTASSTQSKLNAKAKRPLSKELKSLLLDNSNQPGRISKRRSTMASHTFEPVISSTPGKKRRLSYSLKDADNTGSVGASLRQRNHDDGTGNDSTTKRMRIERSPVKPNDVAQAIGTPKPPTPTQMNTNHSALNSVVVASVVAKNAIATVNLSSPQTKQSANRRDKSKAITTPRITQFFTPKSPSITTATSTAAPLKCDQCSIILSSRNELNFHVKSHELNCCVKCRNAIDNDNPISNHVISCFFLDNKVPNDTLTRFLKVKVDLNRLTPTKIKQIQKNLQRNEPEQYQNGDATVSSRSENTKNRRESSQNRRGSLKEPPENTDRRPSNRSQRESTETVQHDKSIDGKKNSAHLMFSFLFFKMYI